MDTKQTDEWSVEFRSANHGWTAVITHGDEPPRKFMSTDIRWLADQAFDYMSAEQATQRKIDENVARKPWPSEGLSR